LPLYELNYNILNQCSNLDWKISIFSDFLVTVVGSGESTLFWHDSWLEKGILRDRCCTLFNLPLDKNVLETNLFRSDWARNGGEWQKRRKLFSNILIRKNILDRWIWKLVHSETYYVKGAYHLLTRDVLKNHLPHLKNQTPSTTKKMMSFFMLNNSFPLLFFKRNYAIVSTGDTANSCFNFGDSMDSSRKWFL